MSQGREGEGRTNEAWSHNPPDAVPRPPIRGVRPAGSFDASAPEPESDLDADRVQPIVDEEIATADSPDPSLDPWGVAHESDLAQPEESPAEPEAPRRGGGSLTIPLLCIGIAVIACVSLLPLADENH